ncbi:MAG: hypothetical protein JWN62_2478 [Acidimicrobiales bacterium]|nr:hypothetical protein [Acidimicrobiales bacterium]
MTVPLASAGDERVGRVEHDPAAAFFAGHAFDHDAATVLDSCDGATTGEHGDRRAGAVSDDDLERGDALAWGDGHPLDLPADAGALTAGELTDGRQAETVEPLLQPLAVEIGCVGLESPGDVAYAHAPTISRSSYPDPVKTRTLLLLAVGCGLVILVAGGIKLLFIADDKVPPHLAVGQSATVGEMVVRVASVNRTGDQTIVDITISGVDDTDGATTFFYGVGAAKELRPVVPEDRAVPECGATRAAAVTTCALAFDTSVAAGVLRYERGGEKAFWDIVSAP